MDRLTDVLQAPDLAAMCSSDIPLFAWHTNRRQQVQLEWEASIAAAHEPRSMDILYWILEAKAAGRFDEALWRAFLAAHFGRASADADGRTIDSAGRLLCGFSDSPIWTWDAVSSGLPVLEIWLRDHAAQLSTLLQFANHRQQGRSKQPAGLFMVIESFVRWVDRHGGTPQRAFSTTGAQTPEAAFDILYHRLMEIHDFGRLACFDTPIFLAELGLLTARPGSCYLEGSSGPLRGARKLWGALPSAELARRADDLARRVPLPYDIVEDALCMWQK
jgi:hypothetical protein